MKIEELREIVASTYCGEDGDALQAALVELETARIIIAMVKEELKYVYRITGTMGIIDAIKRYDALTKEKS